MYFTGLRIHVCIAKVSKSQQCPAKWWQSRGGCALFCQSLNSGYKAAVSKPPIGQASYWLGYM